MTPSEYRERYEAGESILDLAIDGRCQPDEMRELLVNAGASIRPKGGGQGMHRHFHTPTVKGTTDGATRGRIARPSVARWYR